MATNFSLNENDSQVYYCPFCGCNPNFNGVIFSNSGMLDGFRYCIACDNVWAISSAHVTRGDKLRTRDRVCEEYLSPAIDIWRRHWHYPPQDMMEMDALKRYKDEKTPPKKRAEEMCQMIADGLAGLIELCKILDAEKGNDNDNE